jgi:hypothetical protein
MIIKHDLKIVFYYYTIACLKKNERVMNRTDHKLKSFMGWLYITSLLHNININKKYNSI